MLPVSRRRSSLTRPAGPHLILIPPIHWPGRPSRSTAGRRVQKLHRVLLAAGVAGGLGGSSSAAQGPTDVSSGGQPAARLATSFDPDLGDVAKFSAEGRARRDLLGDGELAVELRNRYLIAPPGWQVPAGSEGMSAKVSTASVADGVAGKGRPRRRLGTRPAHLRRCVLPRMHYDVGSMWDGFGTNGTGLADVLGGLGRG